MFLTKKQQIAIALIYSLAFAGAIAACVLFAAGDNAVAAVSFGAAALLMPLLYSRHRLKSGYAEVNRIYSQTVSGFDPQGAVESLKKLPNDPRFAVREPGYDYYFALASCCRLAGDRAAAQKFIDVADSLAGSAADRGWVIQLRGSMAYAVGDVEAGDRYNDLLINSKDTTAYLRDSAENRKKGMRSVALGDWETAIAFYSAEVEKDLSGSVLTDHGAYARYWNRFQLGRALYMAGRADEARPHLEFCAENGGTTYMCREVRSMLETINTTPGV